MVLVSGFSRGCGKFADAEERATEIKQGLEKTPCGGTWEAQLNRKDKHTINWKGIKS